MFKKFFKQWTSKILFPILATVVITGWYLSGWPRIWQNPKIPPEIQITKAAAGGGTNTVNSTSVIQNLAGNTFTFTYTADATKDSGSQTITVPSGWSAPQGTAGTTGYTTVTSTGTVGDVVNNLDTTANWGADNHMILSASTSSKVEGTASLKNTINSFTLANEQWYYNYASPVNLGNANELPTTSIIAFWIVPNISTASGDLYWQDDDSANLASPLDNCSIHQIYMGVWNYISCWIPQRNSISSFGFRYTTDLGAMTINADAVSALFDVAEYATNWTSSDPTNITISTLHTWGDYVEGYYGLRCAFGVNAAANATCYRNKSTAVTFGPGTTVNFWVRSSVATNAGDIQWIDDNSTSLASPEDTVNLPALTANTWTLVTLTAPNSGNMAAASYGFKQVTDLGAFNFDFDAIGKILNTADSTTGWSTSTVEHTLSTDTGTKKEGTGSLSNVISAAAVAGESWYENFASSRNWSNYTTVGFWIRSTVNTNSGDLQFSYDDTASLASPIASLNIGALTANTWSYQKLTLTGTRTSILSYGIKYNTDIGPATINLDYVLAGPGSPTFSGSGPWSITTPFLALDNGQTVTVTYGSGAGASGATASSSTGVHTFTTKNTDVSDGTLTDIASSPTITVNASTQPKMVSGSYTGNGSDGKAITGLGFQPDVVIVKGNTAQVATIKTSSMSGNNSKQVNNSQITTGIKTLDSDGFTLGTDATVNTNGTVYYWSAFKSESASLKVGAYTGNGATGHAITGIGFQPAVVMTWRSDAYAVVGRTKDMAGTPSLDNSYGLEVRLTSFDTDGFTTSNMASVNENGSTYYYIAWKQISGQMKVGSYSGNNADNRNITGIGFQPEYVIVRPYVATTSYLQSSASMAADSTASFNAATNVADKIQQLQSDGFQVGTATNATGTTYYYLAFVKNVNNTPALESISDSPDPVNVGSDITFSSGTWTDANGSDTQKIFVCKTNSLTSQSTGGCAGGSWYSSSSYTSSNPQTGTYTAQAADVGTSPNSYYMFICDSAQTSNSCSSSSSGTFNAQNVITVAASGTKTASLTIPSTGQYVGGAFSFIRNSGTANVTQIIVSEKGNVNANTNLSNLKLYYKQEISCSASIPGDATAFNSSGVGFNGSDQATTTGTMAVGTSQICVYAQVDVGIGALDGQTLDLEISNPSTEVTVSSGAATPATAIAISGSTTLSGTLTVDIVDGSENSVSSPSVYFSSLGFSFGTQTSTGTLGTSSEKIRVLNSKSTVTWTLSIAATSGTTALWSGGTPKYDFNDLSGTTDGSDADSYGGQLTINPSAGTLAAVSPCSSTTGVSKGSSNAYSETTPVVSSISLLTASGSASTNCQWDLTSASLNQEIPESQIPGTYTISFTITIV